MEIEHVQSVILSGLDLLRRKFRRWEDSIDRPEPPTDGGAEHCTLTIESQNSIAADPIW